MNLSSARACSCLLEVGKGSDETTDLSTTPYVDDGKSYRFGAFVKAGRNAVDDHSHPVDFMCDIVGVWTWSGTTIAGSKITFDGYERIGKKPPAQMEVDRLLNRVKCVRRRVVDGDLGESEMKEIEILAREAGRGLMAVMAVRCVVEACPSFLTMHGSRLI